MKKVNRKVVCVEQEGYSKKDVLNELWVKCTYEAMNCGYENALDVQQTGT